MGWFKFKVYFFSPLLWKWPSYALQLATGYPDNRDDTIPIEIALDDKQGQENFLTLLSVERESTWRGTSFGQGFEGLHGDGVKMELGLGVRGA